MNHTVDDALWLILANPLSRVIRPAAICFANEINLTPGATPSFQAEGLDFKGSEDEWRVAALERIAKFGTGAAGFLKP